MEFSKENSATVTVTNLKTMGCCFLCLKAKNIETSNGGGESIARKSVSIADLLRHLQNEESNSSEIVFGTLLESSEKIEAELCESCEATVTSFSVLCQQLEKVQMEMNYFLERIHQCISESAEAPEQIQIYSKRMTSDPEALSQLAFVDNLRKEVKMKSLTRQKKFPRLRVHLEKEQIPVKEEEPQEFQELPIDVVFNNETASPDPLHAPSPPPSEATESLEFKYEFGNSPAIFVDGGDNVSETVSATATSTAITEPFVSVSQIKKQKSRASLLKRVQKKQEKEKMTALRQISKASQFRSDATFRCDLCGKLIKQKWNLECHLRKVHLQEDLAKCPNPQCIFSTPYKNSLSRHMKTCKFNTETQKEIN